MRILKYMTMMVVALPLLIACRKTGHPEDFGLAVSAVWADEADADEDVKLERLWIFDSDGKPLMHSDWDDARELANRLFPIPQGEYTVALGVNISSPFGLSESGLSARDIAVRLEDAMSPFHAFYCTRDVHVSDASRVTTVEMQERRILSEFALEIVGAPQGMSVDISVMNAADAFYPMQKTSDGQYGLVSDKSQEVHIGQMELSSKEGRTPLLKIMPTVSGREYSFFVIKLILSGGEVMESYIEAPRMEVSGKYLMSLKYDEIRSFMHLSACSIKDWTEGWVYNGEITDPTE